VAEPTGFRAEAARTLGDARLLKTLSAATGRFASASRQAVAGMGEWEELREYARQVKGHTLARLDDYLTELETHVTERGGKVFWAPDADAARHYILGVATQHEASLVVKSKSMTTEEIDLTEALARMDIEASKRSRPTWASSLSSWRVSGPTTSLRLRCTRPKKKSAPCSSGTWARRAMTSPR
jgi:L-lactate utilization protein LutB